MSGPNKEPVLNSIAIDALEVLGEEVNLLGAVVGADLHLHTTDGKEWFMNVLTARQFLVEKFAQADQLEAGLDTPHVFDGNQDVVRESFVVNDSVLTEQTLRERFIGRVLSEGLLASMWPIDDEPQTDHPVAS